MGVPQKGTVSSNLILSATLIKFRGHVGKVTRGQGEMQGRDAVAPLPIVNLYTTSCQPVPMSPCPRNFRLGQSPEAQRNQSHPLRHFYQIEGTSGHVGKVTRGDARLDFN